MHGAGLACVRLYGALVHAIESIVGIGNHFWYWSHSEQAPLSGVMGTKGTLDFVGIIPVGHKLNIALPVCDT
jgi:hypothetical protein